MLIKKMTRTFANPTLAAQLQGQLLVEWKNPSDQTQIVIIEEGGNAQPVHLYVIWEAWEPLDQIDRSEIIMNVFTDIHGADKALDVTVAMGLTPAEAQRLGISY